jgi:3,4-dihydroxy 2-butanone 4-phosphate synthase / GTP cyclohydrolase II
MHTQISPIQTIIDDIKHGKMAILIDEEDRENEGDIVIASDFIDAKAINFMAKYARGLICLTLNTQKCKQLNLPLMVTPNSNGAQHGTNFTLSIEAAKGVSTGISAQDRATTIQAANARNAVPNDIVQPGHIFPLMAQDGGVLMRAGHTEAACDLAMLAGLNPSGVICEIMNDDGSMARLPDLIPFAQKHGLNIGTIASLIEYRSQTESIIKLIGTKHMQTPYGEFLAKLYQDTNSNQAHLALVKGMPKPDLETLVRVHEPLSFNDFLNINTKHSWSVHDSMRIIAQQDSSAGVIVLLNCQETTQNFMQSFMYDLNKDSAINGANNNNIKNNADLRTYGVGAQILKDLGVGNMRLLASQRRIPSMTGYGLHITGYYAN